MSRLGMRLVFEWGVRAFGSSHMYNRSLRALRCAEEVIELAQALRVPKEKLHELVDIVYSRPVGDPQQEVGGVLVTLYVLCTAMGMSPEDVFENELSRVLSKPAEHYTKRNQEKIDLGLSC